MVIWERSGEAYYATVAGPAGETLFHLIVESDGDRWDWAVWRPGEDRDQARHGRAVMLHGAMWDAEQAATR